MNPLIIGVIVRTFVKGSGDSLFSSGAFERLAVPLRPFYEKTVTQIAEYPQTRAHGDVRLTVCSIGTHSDEFGRSSPTTCLVLYKGNSSLPAEEFVKVVQQHVLLDADNRCHFRGIDDMSFDASELVTDRIRSGSELNQKLLWFIGLSLVLLSLGAWFFAAQTRIQLQEQPEKKPEKPRENTQLLSFLNRFLATHRPKKYTSPLAEKALVLEFFRVFTQDAFVDHLKEDPETKGSIILGNTSSSKQVIDGIPLFFDNSKLKAIRKYFQTAFLATPPHDMGDNWELLFIQGLQERATQNGWEGSWTVDMRSLLRFLELVSYDFEKSFVAATEVGQLFNSFLFEEYDFMRSDKWFAFLAELRSAVQLNRETRGE